MGEYRTSARQKLRPGHDKMCPVPQGVSQPLSKIYVRDRVFNLIYVNQIKLNKSMGEYITSARQNRRPSGLASVIQNLCLT